MFFFGESFYGNVRFNKGMLWVLKFGRDVGLNLVNIILGFREEEDSFFFYVFVGSGDLGRRGLVWGLCLFFYVIWLG